VPFHGSVRPPSQEISAVWTGETGSAACSMSITDKLHDGVSASIWSAPAGAGLLTFGYLVGPDGSRRIQTDRLMIKRMIKAHPTQIRMPRQADLDPPPRLLSLDPVHRSHARCRALPPVLAWPAASRVVAEDAYQALPLQHRVDQVTVEEWDGVDIGQPWVRLDVEV
jgi:hypothetical protein